jgi:hypothetical protein
MWGTGRNFAALLLVYPLVYTFHLLPRLNFLWERKEQISLIRLVGIFNLHNLYSKPRCHVVSKAFSISKNTAAVDLLFLKFEVMWSASLIHSSAVLWWERKSHWLALSRSLSSMCLWTIFRNTFSNTSPVVDQSPIGHKLLGRYRSLQRFSNVITFACFKGFGNGPAEGSDYVSDVPVVFLEDAWCIRLEYHQVQKPFSISMSLVIYVRHKAVPFPKTQFVPQGQHITFPLRRSTSQCCLRNFRTA